jgi:hypothetical protein
MKKITKTYNVYEFSELSDAAKSEALDDYIANGIDYPWYDCIYDDAKTIGGLMGIDVDNIYFSGFCSQGDGACFEGGYSYKKQCVKLVADYAPLDSELNRIVKTLASIQKRNFYQLSASVKHSGHYYHELCTVVDVDHDNDSSVNGNDENDLIETLRDFMRWIYTQLENEYDYITSEESFIDMCQANEWTFTVDGRIY